MSRVTGILSAAECNKAPFMYEMKGALSGNGPGSAGHPASLFRFVRLPGLPGATRRPPMPGTRCKFQFPGLCIVPGRPPDGARFLR